MECGTGYFKCAGENSDQMCEKFRVVVRNLGIPLHNVHIMLTFVPSIDSGQLSLPLAVGDTSTRREGQFAKGMVAEFYLKTYRLDDCDRHFLAMLKDPTAQAASLCLYSDGYLACEFVFRPRWRGLKRVRNRLAGGANPWLTRSVGENERGMSVMKTYWLPTFMLPDEGLLRFADSVRKAKSDHAPTEPRQ